MERVYLLLRDNQETGPFTIDELWQQQPRLTDLIWVEGESQAWAYPTEIDALRDYLKNKKHLRSGPRSRTDEIERKAEALRKAVMAHKPVFWGEPVRRERPAVPDALWEMEEESIEFIDHRRKGLNAYEYLAAALVTLLVAGSLYSGGSLFRPAPATVQQAQVIAAVRPQPAVLRELVQELPPVNADSSRQQPDTAAKLEAAPVHKTATVRPKPAPVATEADSMPAAQVLAEKKEAPAAAEPVKEETVKKDEPVPVKDTTVTETPAKRKSFGDVLKGIFRKKKKEEARPADAAASLGQ